jgi:hypothetical protein
LRSAFAGSDAPYVNYLGSSCAILLQTGTKQGILGGDNRRRFRKKLDLKKSVSVGLTKGTIPRRIKGTRFREYICGEAVQKLYRSFYI